MQPMIITFDQCFLSDFSKCITTGAKCKMANKCTKTTRQILVDVAEQTVTPAVVTFFEGVEIDICDSLLLFIQCIC